MIIHIIIFYIPNDQLEQKTRWQQCAPASNIELVESTVSKTVPKGREKPQWAPFLHGNQKLEPRNEGAHGKNDESSDHVDNHVGGAASHRTPLQRPPRNDPTDKNTHTTHATECQRKFTTTTNSGKVVTTTPRLLTAYCLLPYCSVAWSSFSTARTRSAADKN